MDLTPAEREEVRLRPADPFLQALTAEQFQLRLGIAKKMCAKFLEVDPTLTPEARALYEAWPMWGFYVEARARANLPKD